MRTPKVSSGNSGYRLWLLAFAVSLLLLVTLFGSHSYDQLSAIRSDENLRFSTTVPSKEHGYPPVLVYWISGTSGDGNRMLRLLKAIYHPRNQYLLQLDAESSDSERTDLGLSIQSYNVFRAAGNVNVVGKSYPINRMGPSALAAVLHAAALLLKLSAHWDWFINLSASDYPLVSQDDLLHAITSLPRDLNFIAFANKSDWKEEWDSKFKQVVVDPSLHLQKKSDLFYAVERRTTPEAFRIFGGKFLPIIASVCKAMPGSPWLMLTRAFMDYCVQGWNNLPRQILLYYSNTAYPLQFYFHTVLCNSPEFQNTTVNTDLRYHILDNPGNGESQYDKMLASGAAFARPFKEGEALTNKIDEDVLDRLPNGLVPGKWYSDKVANSSINIDAVKTGNYGIKLGFLLSKLASKGRMRTSQCHQ